MAHQTPLSGDIVDSITRCFHDLLQRHNQVSSVTLKMFYCLWGASRLVAAHAKQSRWLSLAPWANWHAEVVANLD